MGADATAVFHVDDPGLRARLLERLQQEFAAAGLIEWRLYERFPDGKGDDAQRAHLARMVFGVLGDLADQVLEGDPGVWVVPDDEVPATLDEARQRGVCLTRAHAGTPEQRAADSRLEVDAMTRLAKVLERLPPDAAPAEQLREVLNAFSAPERERLDALAKGQGAASFSEQALRTLVLARPQPTALSGTHTSAPPGLADPRFDGARGRVEAWVRVNEALDALAPSLSVDERVQAVLRALTPPELEALEAQAAEDGEPPFAEQLTRLLLDD
jgi:hypothetical protein